MKNIFGNAFENFVNTPFLHAVSLGMMWNVTQLFVGIRNIHPNMTTLLFIFAFIGGLTTLVGVQWQGSSMMGRGVAGAGLMISSGVWAVDLVLVVILTGGIPSVVPLLFLIASLVTFWRLRRTSREHAAHLHIMREVVERPAESQEGEQS